MASKIALSSSSVGTKFPLLPKLPSSPSSSIHYLSKTTIPNFRIYAKLDGSSAEGEEKKESKRKFITKEEEPQQYWQTAGEREGENPMSTPLPYILIFGMSTPFIILAVAFANGWIKAPIR